MKAAKKTEEEGGQEAAAPTRPSSPRGERTRKALLEAAALVFERDGYLNARIADIAKQAKVAYGSFYTYFPSKRDVFYELAQGAFEEIDSVRPTSFGSDLAPREALRMSVEAFVEAYARQASILRLLEEAAAQEEGLLRLRDEVRARLVGRSVEVIERYQRAGVADPEIDARCTATALASMVEAFSYTWLVVDGQQAFEHDVVIETLTRIWVSGIGLESPSERGAS